jgi:hypothetical protein
MNKIENKIVSYFLEEFGKNNLTAIRLKPIYVKYKEQLPFIDNKLRYTILKSSAYACIPQFATLVYSNSAYKIKLVKDIDSVYKYLNKKYQNPDLDEILTTLNIVLQNVTLTKQRLCECFYYLNDATFTSYSITENKQIIFDMDRNFSLNQQFMQCNSFSDYLEQIKISWQKTELQEKTTLRKLTPAQIDIQITQRNANELWVLHPNKTIAQMIRDNKKELLKECKKQECADSTLRTRIAKIHPNPENYKGGRPTKNKNTSNVHSLKTFT